MFSAAPVSEGVQEPEPVITPLNDSALEAMRARIVKYVTAKLESDMKMLETGYKKEMEAYVNSVRFVVVVVVVVDVKDIISPRFVLNHPGGRED